MLFDLDEDAETQLASLDLHGCFLALGVLATSAALFGSFCDSVSIKHDWCRREYVNLPTRYAVGMVPMVSVEDRCIQRVVVPCEA